MKMPPWNTPSGQRDKVRSERIFHFAVLAKSNIPIGKLRTVAWPAFLFKCLCPQSQDSIFSDLSCKSVNL